MIGEYIAKCVTGKFDNSVVQCWAHKANCHLYTSWGNHSKLMSSEEQEITPKQKITNQITITWVGVWYIWYHQYTRLDSILFSVHDNWGHDFRVANPWRPRRPFGACAWHWATPAQPDQKLYRRLHGSVFNRLAIGSLWVCPTTLNI